MTTLSILKKVAATAGLALVVGASALTPAQAQNSFGFSINGGNGQPSFGFHIGDDNDHRRGSFRCVPTRSLDDVIERQGYRNVRITDIGRRTVEAVGRRSGWLYAISADACTGRIFDTDRLRRS